MLVEEKEIKYYTPDISEFYIDFEYEINDGFRWLKHKLGKIEVFALDDFNNLFLNKSHDNLSNFVRVKYLDEQDFLNLGFEFDRERFILSKVEYDENHKEYFGGVYYIYHTPKHNKITIEYLKVNEFSGEPYYDLYEGNQNHIVKNITCKNKSELIKLMEQLDIL